VSILLDALRKSERQQRKGSLPDIHTDDTPVESSGGVGSRTWVLWSLGAIVVLMLGVYGWRAWQAHLVPTAAPEFTDESTMTEAPPRADTGAGASPAESTATADAGATAKRSPAQAGSPPAATAAAENPGPKLNRQPRSPVETLDTDQPLQAAKPAFPGASEPTRQAGTAPGAAAAPAPTPSAGETPDERTPAQRRRDEQLAVLQRAVENTGVQEEGSPVPPRGAGPDRAPDDGAISFWQLPEMTRNSLPELRINVMVYDEDPSKRFIIMAGKRYVEGAEVNGNLQLETVQRDRALFRYGAYLFYVKQ
jgi:general secretion pathway protein B